MAAGYNREGTAFSRAESGFLRTYGATGSRALPIAILRWLNRP